ncbi:MAG: DNA repair exonuclease [Nitriliruptoraceae bacterium]
MVRFLHTADWQLGMTRHYLRGEAQGRFAQDRLDVIVRMADLARDRECAFVVVAGDVFDTTHPDRRTVDRALDALRAFTVPVLLVAGNHDALVPGAVLRAPTFTQRLPDTVEIVADDVPRHPADGVEVVGAPWRSKRPIGDPVTPVCAAVTPTAARRIVVGHGGVDDLSGDFDDPAIIRLADLEAAVDASGIDYVALGDRHSTTDVGRTGRIWYAGAPEPTSEREVDAGNALVVDLADSRDTPPTVDVVPVGRWRFVEQLWDLAGAADLTRHFAALDARDAKARTVVKIAVTGVVTLEQASALDDGLDARADAFGALQRPERHRDLTIVVDEDELRGHPLPAYVATARDRLVATAQGTGPDAEAARDALGLLLRYAREARR